MFISELVRIRKEKKNDKKRIPTHLLAYLLTLVVGVDN